MESNVVFGHFLVIISGMISFIVPIQNHNRVGGVKTPPYNGALNDRLWSAKALPGTARRCGGGG